MYEYIAARLTSVGIARGKGELSCRTVDRTDLLFVLRTGHDVQQGKPRQ
jgi:hypothetical protein